jgi:S1-C subfamily serine protease
MVALPRALAALSLFSGMACHTPKASGIAEDPPEQARLQSPAEQPQPPAPDPSSEAEEARAAAEEARLEAAIERAADSAPEDAEPPESIQAMVQQSLPAVVLLVQERPDGKLTYGSGFLFSASGADQRPLVLTNLHVVEHGSKVKVMLYRAGRVSYTPMDGGLGRYLFENARDLVAGQVVRSSPTMDLALVKIDADVSKLPRLRLAGQAGKVGDRVYALGHPQETVWSFTSGAVSAIHHGAVQHDAVVSNGSSGGPLLNALGEVVGVNTSRVVSEARGMAFARPADMVAGWLDADAANDTIHFNVLEDAVLDCWRAEEVGSSAAADCLDMERRWAPTADALAALERKLKVTAAERGAFEAHALGGDKAAFLDGVKKGLIAASRGEEAACEPLLAEAAPLPLALQGQRKAALEALLSQSLALDGVEHQRLADQNHLRAHEGDGSFQATLRMGIRLDEVVRVTPALAWVRFAGRNRDGTEFTFAEAWGFHDGRWFQRSPPSPEDEKSLPPGFPRPLEAYPWSVSRDQAVLARRLLGLRREKDRAKVQADATHLSGEAHASLVP